MTIQYFLITIPIIYEKPSIITNLKKDGRYKKIYKLIHVSPHSKSKIIKEIIITSNKFNLYC